MNTTVLSIGKTKSSALVELELNFFKRVQPFFNVKLQYYKTEQKLITELEHLPNQQCVALDEHGKEYTSQQFAQWLDHKKNSAQPVYFIIGDSAGLPNSIQQHCAQQLALSQLTFPHEFARVLLLEQLYRAGTILAGHPYHK